MYVIFFLIYYCLCKVDLPVRFSGSRKSTSSSVAGAERPLELTATATSRKRTSHSRPRTVHDGSSDVKFTLNANKLF